MFLAFAALAAFSAVPANPSANCSLEEGYRDMYNLAFENAHTCFHAWEKVHPEDPFGPVSDAAAYLFSEFDRLKVLRSEFFADDRKFASSHNLKPDPRAKQAFEADLDESKRLAEARFEQNPNDENAEFSTVLRLALHADYEALIDKQYGNALAEIKRARMEAGKLLAKHPQCYDANLAIGVENYLLSLKAAPVRWFLRLTGAETDQQKGIEKLRVVAENGRYLKPYAKVLLAIAALRDNNKPEARNLIAELAGQFPSNDLFRNELRKLS